MKNNGKMKAREFVNSIRGMTIDEIASRMPKTISPITTKCSKEYRDSFHKIAQQNKDLT